MKKTSEHSVPAARMAAPAQEKELDLEPYRRRVSGLAIEGTQHLQSVFGDKSHLQGSPDPECAACDDIYGEANALRELIAEVERLAALHERSAPQDMKPIDLYNFAERIIEDLRFKIESADVMSDSPQFRRKFFGEAIRIVEDKCRAVLAALPAPPVETTTPFCLDADEAEGLRRFLAGEPFTSSTGIHEGLTCGYGDLDGNGFWQFPLPNQIVALIEKGLELYKRAGAPLSQWQDIASAPKDGTNILLSDGVKVSQGGLISQVDQGAEYEGQSGAPSAGWWTVDGIEHPTLWEVIRDAHHGQDATPSHVGSDRC